MEIIEIKVNELPKKVFNKISSAFKHEFNLPVNENMVIELYIDSKSGVKVDITNKMKINVRDKNEMLRLNLEHYVDGHLFYNYGGIVNINLFYANYVDWCKRNNIPYYKHIESLYTERFQKYLAGKGMSSNKFTIYNGTLGVLG